MANEIELIVKGKDQATPALTSVQDGLEGVGTSGKKGSEGTKGLGLSLTDLKSGVDLAVGAFNTFKGAAEAAFNFSAEGASLNQLSESFASTGVSIEALRAAARGTIDDASLMSSTLMLTAGTTREVRDAFSAAAPQLLEMAKAAQKLNPELGDIPFLYNSIATAAKKVSPLIADNLGIIVKQSAANQAYADSIGVAVDSLTDEQRQLAYLNGLLEAGNTLLEQAGGTTASAADGYAILTTHIKNMTDATKASVAEAIGPAIGALAQHVQAVDALSSTTEGYKKKQEGLITILMGNSQATKEYEANMAAAAAGNAAAAQAFNDVGMKAFEIGETVETVTPQIEDLTEEVINLGNAKEHPAALAGAFDMLRSAIQGSLGSEIDKFNEKQQDAQARVEELNTKIALLESKRYLTEAQKNELQELRGELDNSKQAVLDNAASHEEATKRILFGFMEQRLAMDGLTQPELMALQEVASQWGLIDQATLSAMKGIDGVAKSFESGKTPIDEFGAQLAEIGIILSGLPREHTFVMNYVETGAGPGGNSGWKQDAKNREQMYAEGGLVTSSGLALVGEEGPEFVHLPAGSRVIPADRTRQIQQSGGMGDGGVLINVQATINNGMDAELWANRIAEIAGQRTRSRAMGVV